MLIRRLSSLDPVCRTAAELAGLDLGDDLVADAVAQGLRAVGVRVERGTGDRLQVLPNKMDQRLSASSNHSSWLRARAIS